MLNKQYPECKNDKYEIVLAYPLESKQKTLVIRCSNCKCTTGTVANEETKKIAHSKIDNKSDS